MTMITTCQFKGPAGKQVRHDVEPKPIVLIRTIYRGYDSRNYRYYNAHGWQVYARNGTVYTFIGAGGADDLERLTCWVLGVFTWDDIYELPWKTPPMGEAWAA